MEYRFIDYGSMIADHARMDAYVTALELTVRPGDVVLDIGTGTGIMALVASRLGAAEVIAVERDDVIEVARQIAARNGVDDRITFIHGQSTEIKLSRKANVIVSDLRGILPLHSGHLSAIVDARNRLLAPGGVIIPKRDTLWAAVVEAPVTYRDRIETWGQDGLGFDLSPARELAVNAWWKERIEEAQVLTDRWLVASLDYETIDDRGVSSVGLVLGLRAGTANGLCLWFDTELTDGQGFSNAPDKPELIYGSAFFPFQQPVDIQEGDALHIDLRAIPVGNHYVWAWGTSVERSGEVFASYRQSTALGMPLTREMLERSSRQSVPRLTTEGRRARLALELMAGELTLEEIASRVAKRFPDDPETLEFVVRLAQKYSGEVGLR
jgi:protein arginine N-methyltransferase 1